MQVRPIHPFPARMAPDLALDSLQSLRKGCVVLDPMSGSGTVLRQAVGLGHRAIGFDLDPLAVLMSRVWTTGTSESDIQAEYKTLLADAECVDLRRDKLPWLADNSETLEFIKYWFGDEQRRALYRLAYGLHIRSSARLGARRRAATNALAIAFSRIVITKDQGASLARDASHSRPHKVTDASKYDVFAGFERSVTQICARVHDKLPGAATVTLGDARRIPLPKSSVDAVLTSPPYLNAIDYMRGHRLSLVWLGYALSELRAIRATSIGAERANKVDNIDIEKVSAAMSSGNGLPAKHQSMIKRYASDLIAMTSEVARVLKKHGTATFVIGNSCLKGSFVKNSEGVRLAAMLAGLTVVQEKERDLPSSNRYLPITKSGTLSKRMRTETVLSFKKC